MYTDEYLKMLRTEIEEIVAKLESNQEHSSELFLSEVVDLVENDGNFSDFIETTYSELVENPSILEGTREFVKWMRYDNEEMDAVLRYFEENKSEEELEQVLIDWGICNLNGIKQMFRAVHETFRNYRLSTT